MSEEERERLTAHMREQLAIAGMGVIDDDVLRVLVDYVHSSRMATGPRGYAQAYQVIGWVKLTFNVEV